MLLLFNKHLTQESFIAAAEVERNTFLASLFSRIYDSLTSELVLLHYDYSTYYADEYNNFQEFLYKKENLSEEDVEKYTDILEKNPHLELFKREADSYGDYSLEQFIFSESMYPQIENIIQSNRLS